jgi:hypothetical protein
VCLVWIQIRIGSVFSKQACSRPGFRVGYEYETRYQPMQNTLHSSGSYLLKRLSPLTLSSWWPCRWAQSAPPASRQASCRIHGSSARARHWTRTNHWFRIRTGFSANPDPDPAFYLNADPDPDPGCETNADPCECASRFLILVGLCCHKKLDFDMKNTVYLLMPKNIPAYVPVQKPFWIAENQVYLLILVNFLARGSGSAFPIRIRIKPTRIRIRTLGHTHNILINQI